MVLKLLFFFSFYIFYIFIVHLNKVPNHKSTAFLFFWQSMLKYNITYFLAGHNGLIPQLTQSMFLTRE